MSNLYDFHDIVDVMGKIGKVAGHTPEDAIEIVKARDAKLGALMEAWWQARLAIRAHIGKCHESEAKA